MKLLRAISNFNMNFAVKQELKLEDRVNGMDIKEETNEKPNFRLKYPNNIGEFFDRTEPQLILMQVKIN